MAVAIPERQLNRWSVHGPQDGSKRTHEAIRKALESHSWPEGQTYKFFLQGSYANDTNIRVDSDVDVVLKLNDTVRYDHSKLSERDRAELEKSFQHITYKWDGFRRDALAALENRFGGLVKQGNKSIKVEADKSRLAADVVVCVEYRRYDSLESYAEGIAFHDLRDRHRIVNYPKEHRRNGDEKEARTGNRYKRTVRMFKNVRNHLADAGRIARDLAPSYFLECLVYNAPDGAFKNTLQDTYCAIVNWMLKTGPIEEGDSWMSRYEINNAVCQNEQQWLFGETAEHWSLENAVTLSDQLATLWDDWYKR